MPTQDYITLDTLHLTGDLQWTDEYAAGSDLVGQVVSYSITGAQIIHASAQQAGRKMTLVGADGGNGFVGLSRADIDSLRTLAATPGAVYNVTLTDGRTFNVSFSRDGGPAVEATRIKDNWPHADTDWYLVTIRLIMV